MKLLGNRFRILKGGKIGLLSSIGLIASTLMIASINASAVDYFDYADITNNATTVNSTTGGFNEHVTYDTGTNTYTSGELTSKTLSGTLGVVNFAPSIVETSFLSIVHDGLSDDPSVFNVAYEDTNVPTAPTNYTLTFSTDAIASSISKSTNLSIWNAESYTSNQISVDLGLTEYADILENTSSTYVANVIFLGNNEVTGTTNIGTDGDIDVQKTLTFVGDITTGTITFNSTSDSQTQTIAHNVYSNTSTTIGGAGTTALALSDVSATYDYGTGTVIKEFTTGGTIVNVTADVALSSGNLVLADATSAINLGATKTTVGGDLVTNNGGLSFIVDTNDITTATTANSNATNSGQVTVTGALTMTGSEKVHINYVGSLADNGSYTLIDTGSTATSFSADETTSVTDNTFSVDTIVKQATAQDVTDSLATQAGDLIVLADRTGGGSYTADELYVVKSDTDGHFSNDAARVIAGISGTGDQEGDMVQVIQKLELDTFGYGDTQEHLAVQVKKLAPIVNTSFIQTFNGATKLVTDAIGSRISDVRGLASGEEVKDKGIWLKVTGSAADQEQDGQYDGYSVKSVGTAFGFDKEFNNGTILGIAGGYTYSKTEQEDFRNGAESDTNSYQASVYASKTYNGSFVDTSASYTYHQVDGKRATAIDRTASYDVDSQQYSLKISGGHNYKVNNIILTPFVNADYSYTSQDDYAETGADAINLVVDELNTERSSAGLGLKISSNIVTNSSVITPELTLGAKRYFGDDTTDVVAYFEGDTNKTKFTTSSAEMHKVMYNAGLGLKAEINDSTSISFNADYERSDDGDFQGINGQLAVRYVF